MDKMLPPTCRRPVRIAGALGIVVASLAIAPPGQARVQTDLSTPAILASDYTAPPVDTGSGYQATQSQAGPQRPGLDATEINRHALTVLKLRFSF